LEEIKKRAKKLPHIKKILYIIFTVLILMGTYSTYNNYRDHKQLNENIQSYIEMYLDDVAQSFGEHKYNDLLIERVYYLDAYASISGYTSASTNEEIDIYAISNKIKNFSNKDIFNKLNLEDSQYISRFLSAINSDTPPNSSEYLKFLEFVSLKIVE